jgi:hypothetical protein
MKKYLFTEGAITEIESRVQTSSPGRPTDGSLGIGGLKE